MLNPKAWGILYATGLSLIYVWLYYKSCYTIIHHIISCTWCKHKNNITCATVNKWLPFVCCRSLCKSFIYFWHIKTKCFYIWQHTAISKQVLGSAGGKSYAYIWWSFDFKPFLFKDHYCKEYEVWVWRHSDNYFYIILIFEWSQVWFLASPFLGKL